MHRGGAGPRHLRADRRTSSRAPCRTTRASSASPTRPAFRRPTSRNAARRLSSTATTAKRRRPRPTASPRRSTSAKPILPAGSTRPRRRSPRRSLWRGRRPSRSSSPTSRTIPAPAAPPTRLACLRALIAQRAEGAVIGMIVDPEAAAAAVAAGEGAPLDCSVGAKIGYAGETPVTAEWRVVRLGSGDLYRHRPDVWRSALQHRPDGARHRCGERRLGGARRQAHPGRRPGDVSPCRGRAGAGADPGAQIDGAFPRRFSADRRAGAVRRLARRPCLRPGRAAVPQSAQRNPPQPAWPGTQ